MSIAARRRPSNRELQSPVPPPNPQADDGQVDSAALHADDLAAFLRALGLPPVDLVGASYGGLVALELARRHPGLVHALVLAEPAAFNRAVLDFLKASAR